MKLRALLIWCFLGAAGVPLAAALIYVNIDLADRYRQQKFSQLDGLAEIAEARIQAAVDRIHDSVELIGSRTWMRRGLAGWDGPTDAEETTKLQREIDDAARAVDKVAAIFLYDETGQLVASTQGHESTNPIDPEVVSHAPGGADGGVRIGLARIHGSVGAIAQRRLEVDNQVVGSVAVVFDGAFIVDLIADRAGLGRTGEWLFAVRDSDGGALFAVPLKYDPDAAFRRRVPADRVDVPIIQALHGNETILEDAPDYRDVPVLAATRYMRAQDWGLVVKIDEAEVMAPVAKAQRALVVLEIVLLLASLGLGGLLTHLIADPVERLRRVTESIRCGHLEERAEETGWGEARELACSFNAMADSLADLTTNLQDRVDERTRELDAANNELARLATTDPLTGIGNRRYFEQRFDEEFERARRYHRGLSLILLDIDGFKQINDNHGHPVGDAALRRVAERLRHMMRSSDLVARIGGEEFAVVVPEDEPDAIVAFAERLRESVSRIRVAIDRDRAIGFTVSLGVVHLDRSCGSRESLFRRADNALYAAKQAGRDRVCVWRCEHCGNTTGCTTCPDEDSGPPSSFRFASA